MGKKFDSLNRLREAGINVHSYQSLSTLEKLKNYAQENPQFSIRFDRDKDYHSLPFYTYEEGKILDKESFFQKIVEHAKELGCTMLVSNGHQYDSIELANFVMKIEEDSTFLLEYCTEKVPLRDMYEYETSILSGKLSQNIKEMTWLRKDANPLEEKEIERILVWAMGLNIVGKTIEATLYEKEVGIQNERIACWQID